MKTPKQQLEAALRRLTGADGKALKAHIRRKFKQTAERHGEEAALESALYRIQSKQLGH